MTISTNGHVADVVEGFVEAVNQAGTGVRVGGAWHSISKFHPVPLPDQGAHVRVELDAKGFIRTLEVLDQVVASTSSAGPRDRASVRLACLQSAAIFAAGKAVAGTDVKGTDVLKVAEAFERWVLADEEA
jgi:hypothetical protein